ncbi:MAG: multidrug ABC transporter permease [Ignavibacteria bacterium RBG_16_34_14]|nr:MAG: multidrug ABC transporter permease [Ignavibacteria bacterium RBG_16_34_14]
MSLLYYFVKYLSVPFKYSLSNFKSRKLTTFITIAGIALVVFVFAAVLMMAEGIEQTLVATGSPDNAKVVRKNANGEISSIVDGETQNVIRTLPYISKSKTGEQVISNEPVVIINLDKFGGGISNITVRGVSPVVLELRPNIKIIEGRMFNPSLRELIVGESVTKNFQNSQVGKKIKFAGDNWTIVGKFTTDGCGFDSEVWGDALQLQNAFNRGNTVSSVTLKLDNAANFEKFKKAFTSERRLNQFEVKKEQDFFAEQSSFLATFIRVLGIFITVIFSIGAIVGATITMYAAVANRTVEIGTLRALGFRRRSILTVFLFESLLIALIGGVIGIVLASFLQLVSISTLNWNSWSEIAFSFTLSVPIVISSLIFAVFMGIVGGFFPSVRAARLNIVNALRAE